MSTTTLILNQAYMPIDIHNWKSAVKKVIKEKAEVLEEYTDRKLGSWESAMNMPSVIRLLYFMHPPKKISRHQPFTRKNVWLRDKGRCQYCGQFISTREMHWDHVVPRIQGGKTSWGNIVCACLKCNNKKGDHRPGQAGMKLLRRPIAPKLDVPKEKEIVLKIKNLKHVPHEAWKNYIYWNIAMEEEK